MRQVDTWGTFSNVPPEGHVGKRAPQTSDRLTMTRLLPWLTALTLLLTAGLMHGLWTERWQPSTALAEAAARVHDVPLEIGDWQGEDVEVDAEAFAQAGARSYWARTYTNRHGDGTVLAISM